MISKPLLNKLHRLPNVKTPIWIMRQAGRYLPEYLKVRANFKNFMDFCLTPSAAAEVTLQPLNRFDLDAAIIFSDILILPKALGMKVEFVESVGPILDNIKDVNDINKFKLPNLNIFETVGEALNIVKQELIKNYPTKTLIGFAGAPFTIAAYMIEGQGSKDFMKVRRFAISYPTQFQELIDSIISATITYLKIQISHGAEVIKLFDSWAGIVPNNNFNSYVVNPIIKITKAIKQEFPHIPIIVFARNAGHKLKKFSKYGTIDALAIDQYTNLSWCYSNLKTNNDVPILQGNLDNYLLAFGNFRQIEIAVKKILAQAQSKHLIFNLGHGILPNTPIENVEHLINTINGKS